MSLPIDLPEVVAEVRIAFDRYEAALTSNDVPALDDTFWRDPRVIRYALHDEGYGFEAIARARRARDSRDLARRLLRVEITTFGRDVATACCEFERVESGRRGRQSQTWVRLPGGWTIVAAHVSWATPPP